ncbi:MAG: HDOD domain-containing protein [Magnetococcales bacterium]|nr:HDOD domain-containing protein [Magnetococcales bacterium]
MAAKESKEEHRRLRRAERLLENLSMPSRPDVLLDAVRTQAGFAPDPLAVTAVILKDMALSAAVLHAANTQLNGWKRKLISIEGAVALLGLERVRAIVAEQFLSATLVSQEGPLQMVRLRGVEAGRVAARLARELPKAAPHCLNGYLPPVAPDEAYAAGLLHDCGLVAMMRGFPDYVGFCQEMHARGGGDVVAEENERFGTNHCLAGFLMVQRWRLPEPFCRIIRTHHRTDDFNRPGQKVRELGYTVLRAILHLSASVCGGVSVGEWQAVEERITSFFGLEAGQLERLRAPSGGE